MTKTQNTKRMFVTSTIAMIMCIAMLIGSTFAWFTDSKSTSVNQIQAGTLEVDLVDAEGNSLVGAPLDFVKAPGHEGEDILWEPGATYNLKDIYIKNNGNLALKFKISVTGLTGDAKLLEVINFTTNINGVATDLNTYEGHLAAGATSQAIAISGHMDEAAGNEYQGLTLDNIAITVVATQDTVEYDSTDNQYDANATYPAYDITSLTDALVAGGEVNMAGNVTYPANASSTQGLRPILNITKDTTINLNGKSIMADPATTTGSITGVPCLAAVTAPVNVVINGEGAFDAEAGDNSSYCVNVNHPEAVVTINGGKYLGAPTGIQVQQGTLNVTGGFFDMAASCKVAAPQLANYEINCIDGNFKNGTAKINVTGGTFVNFDPSANPEGAGTSYVAEGYTVESAVQANGDTWYTVVPATV